MGRRKGETKGLGFFLGVSCGETKRNKRLVVFFWGGFMERPKGGNQIFQGVPHAESLHDELKMGSVE